eukprot:1387118-Pleurochrysis_carterae.AAC.2
MTKSAGSAGTGTGSARATPVKSSIHTCNYRGAACCAPVGSRPSRCSRSRRSAHRRATAGGGCAVPKRACSAWIAATSVEILANRFKAYAPPNPSRLSTNIPALPS